MISVIVPTYNRADVLHISLDSILKQTYEDIEIIVVDDGSADNTESVVAAYGDSRIRYIRNESDVHGASRARNIGIRESKGEYIAFNDSDDSWRSHKLEKQMQYLNYKDADVVFCQMQIDSTGELIPRKLGDKECNVRKVLCGSFTGTPAYLAKRECILDENFDENMECNEDWELMIRLLAKYKVAYLPEILVDVNVSKGSVSESKKKAIIAMDYILKKHDNLYRTYQLSECRMKYFIQYQQALVDNDWFRRGWCSMIINFFDIISKFRN